MEEEGSLKGLSLQAFQNSYFAGLIRTCPFPVFPVIVPVPVKFGMRHTRLLLWSTGIPHRQS